MSERHKFTRGKMAESLDYSERHWLKTLLDEQLQEPVERLPNDSVDAVIDEEIMRSEKTSNQAKKQAFESRTPSLRQLIGEAGDDEDADKGEKGTPPPPAAQPAQQELNVPDFSREVARIVQNAQSLIDLEGTALRRCLNYVAEHYGNETMTRVRDTLEQDFGVMLQREEDDDRNQPEINAKGAGPEVGG